MSGHSKWATTRRHKAVVDAKKSSTFTKLGNAITIAARLKGGDMNMNFSLRLAVDNARAASMPKDNIERAIKRGTGELEGTQIEEITYEGYGPNGIALLITTITDNRNRTVNEIKHLLTKAGGNLGAVNSVAWMFEKKGLISILPANFNEEAEMCFIENGVEDIIQEDEMVTVVTTPEQLGQVQTAATQFNIPLEGTEITYIPKTPAQADEQTYEKIQSLIETLEDHDDVDRVYSNLS
ncbi:MAG: YebC/PmpR family DNA-binding transcriptional regulator [Patescibacteria group bacterium]